MTSRDITSAAILIEGAAKRLLMSGMLETHPVIYTIADILNELETSRAELAEYELEEDIDRLIKAKAKLKSAQEDAGAHTTLPLPSLHGQSTAAPASSCVDSSEGTGDDWEAL